MAPFCKYPHRSPRRRPFVLLEITIALSLVAICLIPFSQGPFLTLKITQKYLHFCREERASRALMAQFCSDLLQKKIDTDAIPFKKFSKESLKMGGIKKEQRLFVKKTATQEVDQEVGSVQLSQIELEVRGKDKKKNTFSYMFLLKEFKNVSSFQEEETSDQEMYDS